MAAAPSPIITLEELKMIHEIDRNLYSFLTNDLQRDPFDSMRVMAVWLWLEQLGFKDVVKNISCLSHILVGEMANEATRCLTYLTNFNPFNPSPDRIDLPLTQNLLGSQMTPNFFFENRGAAIMGIGKTLTDICVDALTDLMHQAIERDTAQALAETQIAMSSFMENGFSRMNINDFHRTNPRFNKGSKVVHLHPDDRTMFATFSKGYPVPERDIREFFTAMYGDCVETIHMQEVQFGEQSLYARIVFYDPNVITVVLNGVEKAKFTIKGKHIWMRKFVPKRRRSTSPLGTLPPRPGPSGVGSIPGL